MWSMDGVKRIVIQRRVRRRVEGEEDCDTEEGEEEGEDDCDSEEGEEKGEEDG